MKSQYLILNQKISTPKPKDKSQFSKISDEEFDMIVNLCEIEKNMLHLHY